MRPHWVLLPLLSGLVGGAGADLVPRQTDDIISLDDPQPSASDTGGGGDSTSTDGGTATTTNEPDPTSTDPTSTETGGGGDTTTTVTTTVSGEAGKDTTSFTTTTRVSTYTFTDTKFVTATVTSRDQKTATTTVYETTTEVNNNARRWLEVEAERTAPFAEVEAIPTDAGVQPTATADSVNLEMAKKRAGPAEPAAELAKRDTITVTETKTADGGEGSTIVNTRTATKTTTTHVTTTNTLTQTDQADATTTSTVTSTITVTTGDVTTGVTEPTGGSGDNGDNREASSGLSTGAKAGIGAGAGVAGLAIIGALAWFCLRKRSRGPKPDHDEMIGASEVPVGAAGGAAGGAAAIGAARRTPTTHTSSSAGAAKSSLAPEGYRGTAMGDGRTGYAQPETYGAAYTRPSAYNKSVSPGTAYSRPTDRSSTLKSGDVLPEHSTPVEMESESRQPSPMTAELGSEGTAGKWQNPDAAEIDGQPALNQQSGPVYEMPAQGYK